MIIDVHAHIYEYLKPYGSQEGRRSIGKGKIRWSDGRGEQFSRNITAISAASASDG